MITRLRRRHRRIILAIALIVPALLVAALLARHPTPITPALPPAGIASDLLTSGKRQSQLPVGQDICKGPMRTNWRAELREAATSP